MKSEMTSKLSIWNVTYLSHLQGNMAPPSLSQESTIFLIECFKDEPSLWDFNNENYSKKEKRISVLKRIVKKMTDNRDNVSGIIFALNNVDRTL